MVLCLLQLLCRVQLPFCGVWEERKRCDEEIADTSDMLCTCQRETDVEVLATLK